MPIIPETHRDLVEARGVSVLSTVNADGTPQSSLVWHLLDGDVIRTSLLASRHKVTNMRRQPKATFLFFDAANPFRYLEVRADVTIEADDKTMFRRIVTHYGRDPDTFPGADEPRVAVTFTPTRVVSFG